MPTELFASLWLYTALIATSGFTIFWRNVTLAFITLISLYLPDNSFARVCFFNGALLAELCLYIEENYPKLLSWEAKIPRNPLKLFMFVWPVSLAIYGWTLGQRWEYLEIFGVWSRPMLRLGTAIATSTSFVSRFLIPQLQIILTSYGFTAWQEHLSLYWQL